MWRTVENGKNHKLLDFEKTGKRASSILQKTQLHTIRRFQSRIAQNTENQRRKPQHTPRMRTSKRTIYPETSLKKGDLNHEAKTQTTTQKIRRPTLRHRPQNDKRSPQTSEETQTLLHHLRPEVKP